MSCARAAKAVVATTVMKIGPKVTTWVMTKSLVDAGLPVPNAPVSFALTTIEEEQDVSVVMKEANENLTSLLSAGADIDAVLDVLEPFLDRVPQSKDSTIGWFSDMQALSAQFAIAILQRLGLTYKLTCNYIIPLPPDSGVSPSPPHHDAKMRPLNRNCVLQAMQEVLRQHPLGVASAGAHVLISVDYGECRVDFQDEKGHPIPDERVLEIAAAPGRTALTGRPVWVFPVVVLRGFGHAMMLVRSELDDESGVSQVKWFLFDPYGEAATACPRSLWSKAKACLHSRFGIDVQGSGAIGPQDFIQDDNGCLGHSFAFFMMIAFNPFQHPDDLAQTYAHSRDKGRTNTQLAIDWREWMRSHCSDKSWVI